MVLESLALAILANCQNTAHREEAQARLGGLFIRILRIELEPCLERVVARTRSLAAKLQNRPIAAR